MDFCQSINNKPSEANDDEAIIQNLNSIPDAFCPLCIDNVILVDSDTFISIFITYCFPGINERWKNYILCTYFSQFAKTDWVCPKQEDWFDFIVIRSTTNIRIENTLSQHKYIYICINFNSWNKEKE